MEEDEMGMDEETDLGQEAVSGAGDAGEEHC